MVDKFVECPVGPMVPVWRDPKIVKMSREGKLKVPESTNPRKDKTLYGVWLTKAELQLIVTSLKGQAVTSIFGLVIKKAYIRGDFNKR